MAALRCCSVAPTADVKSGGPLRPATTDGCHVIASWTATGGSHPASCPSGRDWRTRASRSWAIASTSTPIAGPRRVRWLKVGGQRLPDRNAETPRDVQQALHRGQCAAALDHADECRGKRWIGDARLGPALFFAKPADVLADALPRVCVDPGAAAFCGTSRARHRGGKPSSAGKQAQELNFA